MQIIDIVCIFIRAERIRDCHLHLSTLQEMPIFRVKRNDSACLPLYLLRAYITIFLISYQILIFLFFYNTKIIPTVSDARFFFFIKHKSKWMKYSIR